MALGSPAAIASGGGHVIVGVGGAFAGAGNYWWQGNRNPNFTAYEFTHGAAGWMPTVLTPPATEFPHSALMATSEGGLGTTLWGATANTLTLNEDIYVRNGDGNFAFVGPGTGPEIRDESLASSGAELNFVGGSSDLAHSVFRVVAFGPTERTGHRGRGNLWPGDTTNPESPSLYEYFYQGQPMAEPLLVGVTNEGKLSHDSEASMTSRCGVELGSGNGGSAYNAVSKDGEVVFFTALACSDGAGEPAVNELYARVGQAKTIRVSEPDVADCGACNTASGLQNALFEGASQGGENVFFLTEQELMGKTGPNLYQYDFDGPEHEKVSLVSGCSAEPAKCSSEADVQGVVRISEDGSHVYFVAKGVLTSANNEGVAPTSGAYNLYVFEPDPTHLGADRIAFVGTLLTLEEEGTLQLEEKEEEGLVRSAAEKAATAEFEKALGEGLGFGEALELAFTVERSTTKELTGALGPGGTLAADRSIWQRSDQRPTQATPDGQHLVFLSSAHLTAGDESKGPQLFEYDAADERLTRISTGFEHGGNVSTFREAPQIPVQSFGIGLPTAEQSGMAISDDGGRIFFTSAARLAPQVEDRGSPNVYEYREGTVYLVSDGRDNSVAAHGPTVQLFGADASGQNVFFLTADALVPQGVEAQVALYDAREEGGFPAPVLLPGCVGETCRGATGATPQLQLPATNDQAGGGNLPPPGASKPTAKPTSKSLTKAKKLAQARKACRSKRSRKKRDLCEATARKRYGAPTKGTVSAHRITHGHHKARGWLR
ncbi:MAG TPA: hypothetical protein VNY52_04115 [Solirubrobacteraceae bacterium]|nr:hypothetical protein [Solirubrobacteraceae bacterium]